MTLLKQNIYHHKDKPQKNAETPRYGYLLEVESSLLANVIFVFLRWFWTTHYYLMI